MNTQRLAWLLRCGLVLCLILTDFRFAAAAAITAIWANDGEDKVTRDDLRATRGTNVRNSVWDGSKVSIFGGRNEVVAFNLVLEAGAAAAGSLTVSFNKLAGPSGAIIASSKATGNGVFNWVGRNIELFYVRYLQIKGLSVLGYNKYDERHIPQRLRRPWSGNGAGSGAWSSRPDHDKFYPEIAVPLELVPSFTIPAGQNQSIWVDVYIPKGTLPGVYKGTLIVQSGGIDAGTVPVELTVYNFTLPDVPSAKTMLVYSAANINHRYLGSTYCDPNGAAGAKAVLLRNRHYLLAHRHRLSLIGDSPGDCGSTADQPCPESVPRMDGSLFTAANGYSGPGANTSNNIYSIGTYGVWSWSTGTQAEMSVHCDAWATWFARNAPAVDYFLYLIDETANTAQVETWARWILNNAGPGGQMKSMATMPLTTAASQTPSLDIPTSTFAVGIASQWQPLAEKYNVDSRKRFYMYNGFRPASGSFMTDDDGVAMRELAWGQFKKHVKRWFYWESTYYNNYQGGMGETNVFQNAQTFGGSSSVDAVSGQTGWNYSNGDGVLFYPGTDLLFPSDSYGVDGPFASLRLKHWRRGLQDADYLALAAQVDTGKVQAIVDQVVPKVLWDYGVDNPSDPTYVHTDISWSNDPDKWDAARAQMAAMIATATAGSQVVPLSLSGMQVYPNPWRADRNSSKPVTFAHLTAGATVKIFTVSGRLIKTLASTDGTATWDLTTGSGDRAGSGIYVYVVKTPDDQSSRGKLAVIR